MTALLGQALDWGAAARAIARDRLRDLASTRELALTGRPTTNRIAMSSPLTEGTRLAWSIGVPETLSSVHLRKLDKTRLQANLPTYH